MKIIQSLPLHLFLCICFLSFPSPSHQQSTSTSTNPRLQNAFKALQAWKKAMTSDPSDFTANWKGSNVCKYNGVFCAPALDDSYGPMTVAGIDLNHANIAGTLPKELGLLTDLALFHLNSNRFTGTFPNTLKNWRLLYELDLSNNLFSCTFPDVFLSLPNLKFIDLRYNYFTGPVPSKLFDLNLDAIFINNNKFKSNFPQNIGNSPVSVAVLANNDLPGCIPPSISNMAKTLNEILLIDVGLKACLPSEIGKLGEVNVFDVSENKLSGPLPSSMGNMKNLQYLNVASNKLSGKIPSSFCSLTKLESFIFSDNFFTSKAPTCMAIEISADDMKSNCIPDCSFQKSAQECSSFSPTNCKTVACAAVY